MPNETSFNITQSCPISFQPKFNQLRRAGYVHQIHNFCLPCQVLCAVLKDGIRLIGGPRLWYKDVPQRDMRDFQYSSPTWTSTSTDSEVGHYHLHKSINTDKTKNLASKLVRRRKCQARADEGRFFPQQLTQAWTTKHNIKGLFF